MTLIELLVVVAVLAVLSVGATLALGRTNTDGTSRDANRFLDLWQRQTDFARQSRTPHGLAVDAGTLVPMRLGTTGWQPNGAPFKLDSRATVAAARALGAGPQPELMILPDGRSLAFRITFSGPPSSTPTQCQSDGWNPVTCN